MTGVDWGWVLGVAVIVWPFAYCALYAIRRGGRALARPIRQALRQARGYIRWCHPQGHGWTGRSNEHPNWLGVCTTCGKVAPPRPGWRRFILMGDCAPTSEAPRG